MKIKCPSCATVGRIPDGKIPPSGANIRCPSCSFVFFVGGPDGLNVEGGETAPVARQATPEGADESGAAGTPASTLPPPEPNAGAESPSAGARGADEPAAEAPPVAPVSAPPAAASTGGFAGYGGSRFAMTGSVPAAPAAAPTAPPVAEPPAEPSPARTTPLRGTPMPTSSRRRAGEDSGTHRVAGETSSPGTGGSVGTAPVASDPTASSVPGLRSTGRSPADPGSSQLPLDPGSSQMPGMESRRRSAAWRIRNALGIVYDFPDDVSARRWLGGRPSLDGLEASGDGGTSWAAVGEHATFAEVRAQGLRSAGSAAALRASRASGAVPAMGSAASGSSTLPPGSTADGWATTTLSNMGASASAATGPAPTAGEAATALTDRLAAAKRAGRQSGAVPSTGGPASRATPAVGRASTSAPPKKQAPWRTIALAAALVLVVGGSVALRYLGAPQSGVAIPDTPAGRELTWVLAMIHGGAETVDSATVASHFAPSVLEQLDAQALKGQLQYWDTWRQSYELVRWARPPSANLLEVRVITEAGDIGVLRVETEPEPPNRIVGLNFRGAE